MEKHALYVQDQEHLQELIKILNSSSETFDSISQLLHQKLFELQTYQNELSKKLTGEILKKVS